MTIVAAPAVSDVAKVYKTLGELTRELLVGLGKGAQGSAAGVADAIVKQHLDDAQRILYLEFDWHTLIRYQDVPLGANQYRLDYPSFMDAERLIQMGVEVSGKWRPVDIGITMDMLDTQHTSPSFPVRYELYEQIELYPVSDQAYTMRIWGMKKLPRFTENGDRCVIDDTFVKLWALATLKAHYQHKDAQVVGNQVEKLRVKLRSKSWKKRVFDANLAQPVGPDWTPLAKPVVIGR